MGECGCMWGVVDEFPCESKRVKKRHGMGRRGGWEWGRVWLR